MLFAAVIEASPKFLPAKPSQSVAAAALALKTTAPMAIAIQGAARLGVTVGTFRSLVAFIKLFALSAQ
jgi:hypothetical protein